MLSNTNSARLGEVSLCSLPKPLVKMSTTLKVALPVIVLLGSVATTEGGGALYASCVQACASVAFALWPACVAACIPALAVPGV